MAGEGICDKHSILCVSPGSYRASGTARHKSMRQGCHSAYEVHVCIVCSIKRHAIKCFAVESRGLENIPRADL